MVLKMFDPVQNATTQLTATTAIASLPPYISVFIAILITIITLVALFVIIKYFRWFCYGLIPSVVAFVAFLISKGSVDQAQTGDFTQLWWQLGVIIGIPTATFLGYLISKTKIVKEWEKKALK